MFLMYTIFSQFRTSSIAICPTPYAGIIENVRTKRIIFGEAPSIRVKKFKQNLRENYSKSNKIAITACEFSKLLRGSMLSDLPKAFLLSQSGFKVVLPNKKTIKNNEKIMATF